MLLVVTVLFCGNVFASEAKLIPVGNVNGVEVSGGVGDEGIMPAWAYNSAFVKKITVYPATRITPTEILYDEGVKKSGSFGLETHVKLTVSKAQQDGLYSQYASKFGHMHMGWLVEVAYQIDATSPLFLELSVGINSEKFRVSNGMFYYEYYVPSVDSIPTCNGIFSYFVNGEATSASVAAVKLEES